MKNKKLLKNSFITLLMVFMLSACNHQTVYHSYQHIPDEGWRKSDTLFFTLPLTDTITGTYKLFVEIRNRNDFPYTDLYLFISHSTTDSCLFLTDTLKCTLANEEGKWKGTGLGSLYQTGFPYKSLPIHRNGNYTFKITQGMKDALLPGINDIGIRIEK